MRRRPRRSTLFPYTTLFRSEKLNSGIWRTGRKRGKMGPPGQSCMFMHTNACSCRNIQVRSEEHTSELQSRRDLVCRLLLEKKKIRQHAHKGQVAPGRAEDML